MIDVNLSEKSVNELHERYKELAVKCADDVVTDRNPEEQRYYDELEELFMELAYREEQGEIPDEEQIQ